MGQTSHRGAMEPWQPVRTAICYFVLMWSHRTLIMHAVTVHAQFNDVADVGIAPLSMRDFKDTSTHDFLFKAARADADNLPVSMKFVVLLSHYVRVSLPTFLPLFDCYMCVVDCMVFGVVLPSQLRPAEAGRGRTPSKTI